MRLEDLQEVALLGTGTFGKVRLMQDKHTKQVFALKALKKAEIVAHRQTQNVINEKNVMIESNHPFILRLYRTFKDTYRLYMLLEFIQGGELFSVLHTAERDGVSNDDARFYGFGVMHGLAYLHERNIAYRDLKPENCMVDSQGYPKLVDFGFAKVIANKSYTLCGTPEYLAPEIVLGRGHDKSVDYWAFGILLYEMIAGYSPFSDPQSMDQIVICRNIVNGRLLFPKNFNRDCKELVKLLLVRDPTHRLGNLKGGAYEVLEDAWFRVIDRNAYFAKELQAPWLPPISDQFDTSNFDPYEEDFLYDDEGLQFVDTASWDHEF
jgi:serine/threonine protein kinase